MRRQWQQCFQNKLLKLKWPPSGHLLTKSHHSKGNFSVCGLDKVIADVIGGLGHWKGDEM